MDVELVFMTPDGEHHRVVREWPGDSLEECFGWWTYGNGGCDCNRRIAIEGEYGDYPCGETIALVGVMKANAT